MNFFLARVVVVDHPVPADMEMVTVTEDEGTIAVTVAHQCLEDVDMKELG